MSLSIAPTVVVCTHAQQRVTVVTGDRTDAVYSDDADDERSRYCNSMAS